MRHRGHAICAKIQSLPQGTCVHIKVNDSGIPFNISESILGFYIRVVARDPMLAPILFLDWHSKVMKPFK